MWPTKFNCRYIDCVLIAHSQEKKKEITHIVAVQITLKPFNQHLESYQFYTKDHDDGMIDYERYLTAEDRKGKVQRHFVWIGRRTSRKKTLDMEENTRAGMSADENVKVRFVYWEPI
eukprot:scaffold14352_cov361-Ochromonas_danica.AAC.1